MTKRIKKNISASIRDRLLERSRDTGEDFQFLLHRYAAERFLYRLGKSGYRKSFVLKGAMLFAIWGGPLYRPTRDLDFEGFGTGGAENIVETFREICGNTELNDGLMFEPDTFTAEPIREELEHAGLRVRFQVKLGIVRIPMQIDIGFGDAIEPPPEDVEYPTLLDFPAPGIRAYPKEAVVAEKAHALVVIGERNSRLKDLYDLQAMLNCFRFEGERLMRSIAATFNRRKTNIEVEMPAALTQRFFMDAFRRDQWRSYLTRNHLPGAPADLAIVGEALMSFFNPVWSSLAEGSEFNLVWEPGGPWKGKRKDEG